MSKLIAFSGSNSSTSINFQLINTLSAPFEENIKVIRLTDYAIPMYSADSEAASGIPTGVIELAGVLKEASGLLISVPEYNGNMPAFFKNCMDWLSRYDGKFLADKPVLLLSTSPGQRGGASSLNAAKAMLPYFGAIVQHTFSLGAFHSHFSEGNLLESETTNELKSTVAAFVNGIK
jgi:chromate reductase